MGGSSGVSDTMVASCFLWGLPQKGSFPLVALQNQQDRFPLFAL